LDLFHNAIATSVASVLFKAYGRFAGSQALELCRQLDVSVLYTLNQRSGRADLRVVYDSHGRPVWKILLSNEGISDARRDLSIFHELGHYLSFICGNVLPLGTGQYWQMESWCDNFAVAMLFAQIGYSVVGEEEAEFFGRFSGAGTPVEADRRAGEMLAGICKEASASVEASLLEPIFELSMDLLVTANT